MWSSVVSVHQSPRAAIYRNIGELEQGWTWEQSDLLIFSDCNFAFWASTGDLPWKQLPVELKSKSSAVGVIKPLISVLDTDSDLFNTPSYLKIVFKNCKCMMKSCAETVQTNFCSRLLLKSVFPPAPHPSPLPPTPQKKAGLACHLPAWLVPDGA